MKDITFEAMKFVRINDEVNVFLNEYLRRSRQVENVEVKYTLN